MVGVEKDIDFAVRPPGVRTRKVLVKLRHFKLDQIDAASLVFIIGHRESGRSTLIKDVLHHFRSYALSDVVVDSDRDEYRKVVPGCSLTQDPDVEMVLASIIQRQDQGPPDVKAVPPTLLVMDNPLLSVGWQYEANMNRILTTGKQLNLLRLFSMSYVRHIDEAVKASIDWVFIFKANGCCDKEHLHSLCNCFPNRAVFDRVLEDVTEDYGCLVIDRKKNEAFWYRAPAVNTNHFTSNVQSEG